MHSPRTSLSRRAFLTAAGTLAIASTLAACGGGSSRSETVLRVVYQKTSAFYQLHDLLTKAKSEYEAAHSGMTVELVPIDSPWVLFRFLTWKDLEHA